MTEIRVLKPDSFPEQLLEIPEPPKRLYVRGTIPPPETTLLAVVGSRKYTSYGKEVCEKIIHELSASRRRQPVAIVSGLALGIDAIAHKAALDAGLPTIAVPGSGLAPSALYPATHRPLAERIISSGGALLSEFEPEFRATPYSFPQRNRIMAGLSRGVLVVEAAKKSGTLITARLGTEYNRDVFTVPASIFSPNAAGSNQLLKLGAVPTVSGADILEHWGIIAAGEESGARQQALFDNCSPKERRVLEVLQGPLPRDELTRRLDMPAREMNILLSAMEIKGMIKESLGCIRVN